MMEKNETRVLDRAICLAVRAHEGMLRKKDEAPYILHPMEVAVIAGMLTKDLEVLAAALLHDAVEDANVSLDEIRTTCSERVALLVASETEEKYRHLPGKETWKRRKEESLRILREASDPGTRIIWLSDKLANLRSMYRLWKKEGNAMWTGFNQSDPAEQAWYFRTVASLTAEFKDTDVWREFNDLISNVFGGTENGSQLSN